ncbi:MAG: OmpA family protein [Neptuniibacter sp.]
MKNGFQFTVVALVFGFLAGCGAYSDLVNGFAPEKNTWDIELTSGGFIRGGTGQAHVCVAPPHREVYMVMPEEGKEGTVVVTLAEGREVVLHGDYSAMSVVGADERVYTGNEEELRKEFGSAVSALPLAPLVSRLNFITGTSALTPESENKADAIYSNVLKRQAVEVHVVGHTDTVGGDDLNEKLSLKRAEAVRGSLIELGVPADAIKVSGAGETELLVETPDNSDEPLNRRVEINVR